MSHAAKVSVLNAFREAVRPPEKIDYATWCEENVRLPESSAISGRYRLWKYQRRILEAVGDSTIERVSVMKPTRIGYTRLLCASLGADMANDPCAVMLLLPTDDDARGIMVDEVEPTFAESPKIKALMRPGTLTFRRFVGGGSLKALAARAPRNLRRHTVRKLYCDEVDGMEVTKEGDPVTLAEKRTESFADRKIVKGSTPVDKETSIIAREYGNSDQRVFKVPCPQCGHRFEILWEHMHFDRDDPSDCAVICPDKGCVIEERHKPEMVELGDFEITNPKVKDHAGFRLNAMVSLQPKASWAILAKEFVTAKKGGASMLQTFTNTALGLPWSSTLESLDEGDLRARAERFGIFWSDNLQKWCVDIPEEVLYIYAGVDVQPDRLEIVLLGRSSLGQRFILGHHVIVGSTTLPSTWDDLDHFLMLKWRHPLGNQIGIVAAAIDSGDGNRTTQVYEFCGPRQDRHIYAIKGREGPIEWFKFTTSRRARRFGAQLAHVGVDSIKSVILSDQSFGPTHNAAFRFSDTLPPEWYVQFTSEREKVEYKKGRPVKTFVRIGQRAAEALDCTVYAMALWRNTKRIHIDFEAQRKILTAPRPPAVSGRESFREKVRKLHR